MSKVDRLREMREANYQKAKEPRGAKPEPATLTAAKLTKALESPAKLLGAKGGKSKSPAKQSASKANGKKGGKPKQNPSA